MRTPGHDYELAVGFLFGEGLLAGHPVQEVRYCATGSAVDTGFNVVSVSTGGNAPEPTARLGTTTSSCGLCGSVTIDELAERLVPFDRAVDLDVAVVQRVVDAVRADQELFRLTGSVHAAAAFTLDSGEVALVREDVGRHNAVDKVVGRLHLDGVVGSASEQTPVSGASITGAANHQRGVVGSASSIGAANHQRGLFVSGRVSFEIVQKAWAAGFRAVVAVSGPTALAVETAQRANLALAGFVRDGAFNRYA
jgi:FdhD protein